MDESLVDRIFRAKDRFKGRERKAPVVELTPRATQKLSEILRRPNPSLAEIPFLGAGHENVIEEVLALPSYPRKSGLSAETPAVFKSSVDGKELQMLFDLVYEGGAMESVLALGHLHPTGKIKIEQTVYVIDPSETLLDPSMPGDIDFFKSFSKLNPNLIIPYIAIAANTPSGPKIKFWNTSDLLKVKKPSDIEKAPSKIFTLI